MSALYAYGQNMFEAEESVAYNKTASGHTSERCAQIESRLQRTERREYRRHRDTWRKHEQRARIWQQGLPIKRPPSHYATFSPFACRVPKDYMASILKESGIRRCEHRVL